MKLCNKTKIIISVYLKHWVPWINQSSELFHKDKYGQIIPKSSCCCFHSLFGGFS